MWYVHDVEGGCVVTDEATDTGSHAPEHIMPSRRIAEKHANRLIAIDMQMLALDRVYPGRLLIGVTRVRRSRT